MAQRLSYDYNYQRQKVSKINEIESYVSVLIQNNKNYADELNILRKENTDLRGQVEMLMGQLLKAKENYEDSLAETKGMYSHEIGTLIEELKDILNKKEQMEGSYKSLLQQLSYQSEFDKSNRASQIDQIERNYENKIKILNERISEQNKELQATFYLNSDNKIKMVKEIDSLRFQIGQLKKINNDLLQSQAYQQNEINRLSLSLKHICKEKEEMGVNLLKIEQDKNHSIIELRQASALLREQLNDQVDNIKSLEVSLASKEKEHQILIDRFEHEQRDKCQYQDAYQKITAEVAERDTELATIKAEYKRLSENTGKQLKRMGDLIKILESDNSRLSKERQQLETQNLEKQQEIYTLLQRIQKIERQFELSSDRMNHLEAENNKIAKQNDMLKEELEIQQLEQKKMSQKCLLQANHIQTIERLLDKEKKRNIYNQNVNADRENVYSKQISCENELNHRNELEIQALVKEKGQLLTKFEVQKERLIRMYENALHEKDVLFKEKIRFLENEISDLSR